MKEKIICVCAGRIFRQNIEAIKNLYTIVALADNKKAGETVEGFQCIGIERITSYDYDKIVICSMSYEATIKRQLLDLEIPENQICSIEKLKKQLYYTADMDKYETDKYSYIKKCMEQRMENFLYDKENEMPMLADYRETAGNVDGHYFLMDILMAREVAKRRPGKHFDIGSRIDGFISHLLALGIDTTVIDIRSLCEINAGEGIKLNFIQADATNLNNIPDCSIESLSALHSIEHFGLGRYGDAIDPKAHLKVVHAMTRVLTAGGYLYFAVPVGKEEKLCFNAHRICYPLTIIEYFSELKLEKMCLLHEMRFYEYSIEELQEEKFGDVIGEYDCGLFIFKRDSY